MEKGIKAQEVMVGNVVKKTPSSTITKEAETIKQSFVDFITREGKGFAQIVTIKQRVNAFQIDISYSNDVPPSFLPDLHERFKSASIAHVNSSNDCVYLPYDSFLDTKVGKLKARAQRALNFFIYLIAIGLFLFILYLNRLNKPRRYTFSPL